MSIETRLLFDDDRWLAYVHQVGVVSAAAGLRDLIQDIGNQENQRNDGMSLIRRSDPDYDFLRRDLVRWRKSATAVRRKAKARLAAIQPSVDDAGEDRRALMILARRIWLWEQGAVNNGLASALDEVTISGGTNAERIPLRVLVERLAAAGEVVP